MDQHHSAASRISAFAPQKHNDTANSYYPVALGVAKDNVTCLRIGCGYAVLAAWVAFTGHSLVYSDSLERHIAFTSDLLASALAIYLTWRTYKQPTTFLICAFAWIALDLGAKLFAVRDANASDYWMQVVGLIAAVSVVGAAIAVCRFGAEANARGVG
jgi:hypothetical protein